MEVMESGAELPTLALEPDHREMICNPTAQTDAQRERLLDRIEASDWGPDAVNLTRGSNAQIYSHLLSFTISRNQATGNCGWSTNRFQQHTESLRFIFAFMIGWLARLLNQSIYVFPQIAISLYLLSAKATSAIWSGLSKMRLSYDKPFTKRLCRDLGIRQMDPARFPTWASRDVGIVVLDNFLHKFLCSFEQKDKKNEYYQTINWFVVPVPATLVPAEYNPDGTCLSHHIAN